MLQGAGELLSRVANGRSDGKAGDQAVDLGFDAAPRLGTPIWTGRSPWSRIQRCCAAFTRAGGTTRNTAASRSSSCSDSARRSCRSRLRRSRPLPDLDQLALLPEIPSVAHTWAGTALERAAQRRATRAGTGQGQGAGRSTTRSGGSDEDGSTLQACQLCGPPEPGGAGAADRGPPWRGRSPEVVPRKASPEARPNETVFPGVEYRLTNDLLNSGEREAVTSFF